MRHRNTVGSNDKIPRFRVEMGKYMTLTATGAWNPGETSRAHREVNESSQVIICAVAYTFETRTVIAILC